MATTSETRTRAPRGTKILTQAFFAALDDIPHAQQDAVAKAALAAVREQLQLRRQKAKAQTERTRAAIRPAARAANGRARPSARP